MSKSKIEWTERVWNPVTGCTKVSQGCKNCYAERMAKRLAGRCGYPADEPFRVTLHPDRLGQPLHWKKPSRIFVNSMSDLFHQDVPDEFIERVWAEMYSNAQHTFQVLTKRPERMLHWYRHSIRASMSLEFPPGNIWLGVSAENQETADQRIPLLLQTPAAVRFVSCEPLLGPVDLCEWLCCTACADTCGGTRKPAGLSVVAHCKNPRLDWVIAGGESGPGARPMHPDWARGLRDQCAAARVPYFFKQWGEWRPPAEGEEYNTMNSGPRQARLVDQCGNIHCTREASGPDAVTMICVGKVGAGNCLDDRQHLEFPSTRSRGRDD